MQPGSRLHRSPEENCLSGPRLGEHLAPLGFPGDPADQFGTGQPHDVVEEQRCSSRVWQLSHTRTGFG